jgi:hypothetical protein
MTVDHSRGILRKESHNYISETSTSSKVWEIQSLHRSHIKHKGAKFHSGRTFTKPIPPTNQYIKHSMQHHPINSKETKNIDPQHIGKITVK